MSLSGRRVLLVIGGGIAAYKSLELIRLLRRDGCAVRCVLTASGAEFVTALSAQALSEDRVYESLFALTDESAMGHIQLSRDADLIVVAPATASLLARMAAGLADDLATTVLLATDKPVLVAPAMNVRMWTHAATVANVMTLRARGIAFVGPEAGAMACNEWGVGRLAEPDAILGAIRAMLRAGPLAGKRALVTSGPTHEPIDPVRFIANRSSGRQGHAIAAALARAGADVTLVRGPVAIADPPCVAVIPVETAAEMLDACLAALPVDVAVFAAAVADWHVANPGAHKLKRGDGTPVIDLAPNTDILATIAAGAAGAPRPALVVGFAAETSLDPDALARKRVRKGADWLLANDVSAGVFGADDNTVTVFSADGAEAWPTLPKTAVAERLAARIAEALR